MFAEPHHADTAFYEPRIIVETQRGKRKEIEEAPFSSRPLRIPDWHFQRLLLVKAYGAMSPSSPFGHFPDDTPAAFEARLDAFFDAVVEDPRGPDGKPRKRRLLPAGARTLRLELARVIPASPEGAPLVHVVGRYDLKTRTFRREMR